MNILRLHLKGEYFDAIAAGRKTEEYRLASVWQGKLKDRHYDEIHLFRGYPKRGDETKVLYRQWNGYTVRKILHEHFGNRPVKVLAIDVSRHVGSHGTSIMDGHATFIPRPPLTKSAKTKPVVPYPKSWLVRYEQLFGKPFRWSEFGGQGIPAQ